MKLNKEEKKIYKAIMLAFPKTKKEVALDHAIARGANYQFINK